VPFLLHLFGREHNEQNAHNEFNTFKFAIIYFYLCSDDSVKQNKRKNTFRGETSEEQCSKVNNFSLKKC